MIYLWNGLLVALALLSQPQYAAGLDLTWLPADPYGPLPMSKRFLDKVLDTLFTHLLLCLEYCSRPFLLIMPVSGCFVYSSIDCAKSRSSHQQCPVRPLNFRLMCEDELFHPNQTNRMDVATSPLSVCLSSWLFMQRRTNTS